MRWTVKRVVIQGFRSFKKKTEFVFSDLPFPAFVFVSGDNRVDERLEGNAAGKSTLFAALQYVLFGRTLEIKGTDLKSWKGKQRCFVELYLKNDEGEETIIIRQRDPNRLTVDGAVVEQDALENMLGYNLDSFGYAVMVSQFSKKFFDLGPSEKMLLFDSIMHEDLEIWMQASELAKSDVGALELEISEANTTIANLEGQLEAMRSVDYAVEIKKWNEEQDEKINDLLKQIADKKEELDGFVIEEKKVRNRLVSIKEKVAVTSKELASLIKERTQEQEAISSLQVDVRAQQRYIKDAEKALEALSGLEGTCPTCKQAVDARHLAVERRSMRIKASDRAEALKGLESCLNKRNAREKELIDKIITLEDFLDDNKPSLIERDVYIVETNIRLCKQDIINYQNSLDKCRKETNPYLEKTREAAKEATRTKSRIDRARKELSVLQSIMSTKQYWQKGFKEIRLSVVAAAVADLEISVNDYLVRLGLDEGWEIKIEMDKETKSKTVQKGFTVFVSSPETNNEFVPFDCWSGGEGQRLRLAGTLALMDFIHDRRGRDWSIEVWDEPTQWLSKGGIFDLLEVLKQRAEEKNRQVFIIDHRDFASSGDFDVQIKVVKDIDGSSVQV